MNTPRKKFVSFLADQDVGLDAVRFVLERYPQHVKNVVTLSCNQITELARTSDCQTLYWHEITPETSKLIFDGVEIIFLAWWPKIIPHFIINAPTVGVVNFHPSLLPYNRGKNYNFWTIVESSPFGVTLHFVDEGIDSGDILFQAPIVKTWEDTGGTLYLKAKQEILRLFKNHYIDIIEGRFTPKTQDSTLATIHYSREIDAYSQLNLDKSYQLKELLNLIRARTFEGKPACYFFDNGRKFEVRVSIREVANGTN
jgi:methionyl-tRNA formyltransferase